MEVQRIKQLETENRKLKQLARDQALALQTINEFSNKMGLDLPSIEDCGNTNRKASVRKTGLWRSAVNLATVYPTGGLLFSGCRSIAQARQFVRNSGFGCSRSVGIRMERGWPAALHFGKDPITLAEA
jgi:hypothetical protein